MISVYRPGTSLVHRAPAGVKLLALLAFTSALLIWRAPVTVAIGAVVVLLAYAAAGFSPLTAARQVWPMRWIILLLIPFQWWWAGWQSAIAIVGTLILAVAAAALVSLTTRMTDLLAVLDRTLAPLRHLRIDPARISLLIALSIRAIPVLVDLTQQVRDARRARGAERSMRAFATPVVVRTVGHSQRLGDALIARGVDD
jgi:biotin transport system permease protein